LAEVEVRGVHRARRCASLYTYCIYELRFSEDAAARRSAAARFVKQFPALFDALAEGELHLTGLLMIGPHLTPENHATVLGRAKFRTKKELAKLVRDLNPLPAVPDCIAPLGPALSRGLRNLTWARSVAALCGPVRELSAGERPRDWANDGELSEASCELLAAEGETLPVGPAPRDLPPVTGPQHYQLQFSAVEEHVVLIERAKALLARERPGVTLGELHFEAMKVFVAALEKRKFAVTARPRKPTNSPVTGAKPPAQQPPRPEAPSEASAADRREASEAPRQRGTRIPATEQAEPPRQRGTRTPAAEQAEPPRQRGTRIAATEQAERPRQRRQRSRHIPAAERREVYRRDGERCTYVDGRGERCCETQYLELHHLEPFARGGANVASNLALRCAAHNALAAEADFGKELIAKRRDSTRHESLAAQAVGSD
jgi:5-methylcytosine-specific restriction endonuclease McrA